MKNKKVKIFIILYIALLSIFIRGYTFGLGDQVIHLPLLFKAQDPTLYLNDYLFTAGQESFTFFYSSVANLIELFNNVETVFFTLYVLLIFVYFYVISQISQELFKNKLAWFFSLLLFITPFYIGGAAITTVETSIAPRTVGNLLSLLILLLILKKKFNVAFIVLGIEFLLHPLSALYIGIIMYSHLIIIEKMKIKKLIIGSLLFLIISLPLLPFLLNQFTANVDSFNSSIWLEVLKERNAYVFPHLWNVGSWLTLVIGIVPILIYLIKKIYDGSKNSYVNLTMLNIVCISFVVFVIQYIFTLFIPLSQIIKLQLGRILFFPVFLSLLCLGYYMERLRVLLKINTKLTVITITFLLTTVCLLTLPSFVKGQNRKWIEVQLWGNSYTSKECVFLVPFFSEGFRVYSRRPTTGEYKDGTLSFYSQQFANEWNERLSDLGIWEHNDEESIKDLQRKYNFSFIVTSINTTYDLKLDFINDNYRVYEMPVLKEDCKIR